MLLQKTDKARLELSPGVRTLGLRERSLLLLADGKSLAHLQAMYNGMGAQIVADLIREGYLEAPEAGAVEVNDARPSASASSTAAHPADALRSLAGARMYLFDMCERMFARRDPSLARQFHEALRNARDRESMLDVGEALLEEIAQMAGAERAQTVRDRLEQLLPNAQAHT